MVIRFLCPQGHKLVVPDHRAGKKGRCPVCNLKVFIPSGAPLKPEGENGQPLRAGPGQMVHVDPLPNAAIGFDDGVTFQEALAGRPPVKPYLVGMENISPSAQEAASPTQQPPSPPVPKPSNDPELGIMPLEPTRPAFPYQQPPQQPGMPPHQQVPPPGGQQPPHGPQG